MRPRLPQWAWRFRRIIAGAAAAVLLAALLPVLYRAYGSRPAITTARRGDLRLSVPISGTLKSADAVRLGPPQVPRVWQFKIAMMEEEGKTVKAGTPVLAFDTTQLRQELLQRDSERDQALAKRTQQLEEASLHQQNGSLKVAQAEAALKKLRLKPKVPPELRAASELKQTELDEALAVKTVSRLRQQLADAEGEDKAALEAIQGDLDRAQGRVEELQAALESMTIRAPRDGTVIYVQDDDGQKKKVGDTCWWGGKVLEVADLTRMEAEGEAAESYLGRIAVGQNVSLRLDAQPDLTLTGRVAALAPALQPQSKTVPLKVAKLQITLDATQAVRLLPGMRFEGEVETGLLHSALTVPAAVVYPAPDGPRVWKRTVLGWRPVRVTIGARTRDCVQILSGLSGGSAVAPPPANGGGP